MWTFCFPVSGGTCLGIRWIGGNSHSPFQGPHFASSPVEKKNLSWSRYGYFLEQHSFPIKENILEQAGGKYGIS